MTSMTFPAYSHGGEPGGRLGKVAVIIALHAGLFFLMKNGMLHRAVQQLPEVVNITFVAPPAPPAPPVLPKTVEVAHKAPNIVTPPLPMLPVVIENTITVPPSLPRTAAPSPAPVAAAPVSAPSAPATPAPAGPRVVSGVEYIRAPQPVYPSMSRRMSEQGVVMLRVLVNEQGRAEQASVQQSSGFSGLDEAGRQAAMRTLFKPYLEDGKAIPVYVIVPINFRMS
jgi:protein TonB